MIKQSIPMVKVLELFSGTGSVGKCCKELGWEVVSVDMILPADHQCDIMDFDYKQYPKDYFNCVASSPPCTNYSMLKKCWYGRKLKDGTIYSKEQNDKDQDEADKLVLKTMEIIQYFDPELWIVIGVIKKEQEYGLIKKIGLVNYVMVVVLVVI